MENLEASTGNVFHVLRLKPRLVLGNIWVLLQGNSEEQPYEVVNQYELDQERDRSSNGCPVLQAPAVKVETEPVTEQVLLRQEISKCFIRALSTVGGICWVVI